MTTQGTNSPRLNWSQHLFALFTSAFWRDWYSRPCGASEVLRLAAPVIISSGSIALMNFADRIFLAWFDPRGMNAAFQAGSLFWAFITFPAAIAAFVTTFVSQYYGARQYRRIGSVVWQGTFFGVLFGLFFIAATPFVESFFSRLGASPELAALEKDYWFFFSLGACAAISHEAFVGFFCGRRKMKTVMTVGLIAVALNVVLDPIMIFGLLGCPRMGVSGAALASAISIWVKFLIYLVLTIRDVDARECGVFEGFKLSLSETGRLLKFGSMSAIQVTLENSLFTLFILLMGWYGEEASSASAIAFNMNILVFMPMLGLGITTQTLVGNMVGERRFDLASRAVRTVVVMSLAFSGFFALMFMLFPNFFLNFYSMKNPEAFEPIRELSVNLLRFVALYLFADTMNVVFSASLRGAGDARFIMFGTICAVVPCLTLVFVGALVWNQSVYWCWTWITSYLFANAIIFGVRFKRGRWQTKGFVNDSPQMSGEFKNA